MKQRYGKRVRAAVSSIDDDEKVAALAIWLLRAELKRRGKLQTRRAEQKEKGVPRAHKRKRKHKSSVC